MPFFTFKQFDEPTEIREHLVCIEGDNENDIMERARWFGLDFEERTPRYNYLRWLGVDSQSNITWMPTYRGDRLHYRSESWIIVYKNGNLKSSGHFNVDMA